MPLTHESAIPLAILISGNGSTMEEMLWKSRRGGRLYGKIAPVVVISSKKEAEGVRKAEALEIPVVVIQRKDFEKGDARQQAFGDQLIATFKSHGATVFSQNGWLPLTPARVATEFEGYNQHPVPLDPDHPGSDGMPLHFGGKGMHGLAAHAAVLEFQRRAERSFPTEATIHRVAPQIDGGFVVFRRAVPVLGGDTPPVLAERVLPREHDIQILFWNDRYEGIVPALHRTSPLIFDYEEPLLRQAILYGREMYPKG